MKRLIIVFIILCAPLVVSAQSRKFPNRFSTQIARVSDGDTIRVNRRGEWIAVRLACINAPQMAEYPYGVAAMRRLQQLLPIGQSISLTVVDVNPNQQLVAEIYRNQTSINLQMVSEGQAVVNHAHLSKCPQLRQSLLEAENQARQQRLGVWQQSNPAYFMPRR